MDNDLLGLLALMSVILFVLGIVFLIISFRTKAFEKKYYLAMAMSCLSPIFFSIIAILTNKINIFAFACFFSFGLLIALLVAFSISKHKNCTHPLEAEAVSIDYRSPKYRYAQVTFSYKFNGEKITSKSFTLYTNRKVKKLFSKGQKYKIMINPIFPSHCTDKRYFPYGSIILLSLFSFLFMFFSIIMLFTKI